MKKQIIRVLMVLVTAGLTTALQADTKKPPRPEKIEEVKSTQPSEYHIWVSGRWKWKNKEQSWLWREGYWKFDHDLYAFRNRYRYGNYFYPRFYRYALVPIARGYYRLVRY